VTIGGSEALQIVCGAPNVREGMAVAVATLGSFLPAVNLTIKPAVLRGVDSCGMLCSLAEMGLQASAEGLVDLEVLAKISGRALPGLGEAVAPLLGLDDRILELAITANRPDGLSMLGIAREVAAIEEVTMQAPEVVPGPNAKSLDPGPFSAFSSLFSITALSGVTVAPSPAWLQQRLEAAGLRPVNNVVDITNLVMLETGQPLHAYDSEQLGNAAVETFGVRLAKADETLVTLDGQERQLDPQQLVVTHADKPIALAGLIGGQGSAVGPSTRQIWLEAAVFNPTDVRLSSRRAGLRTEASSRFERGVARAATLAAADRAVNLLQALASAELGDRWLAQVEHPEPGPVLLRRSALERLLGPLAGEDGYEEIDDGTVEGILTRLGCSLQLDGENWLVTVPPSRQLDLLREVDLIEELARLIGYDRFCSHLPDPVEAGGLELEGQLLRRLRAALRGAGLQEISHLSLGAHDPDAEHQVALGNPLLADYGHLRTSLHQGLIQAAARNLQASQPGFWGFEIGKIFRVREGQYEEEQRLSGLICGERRSERWSSSGQPRPLEYFQARGLLAQGLRELGLELQDRRCQDDPQLHPGRAAQLVLEGKVVGKFGQLHPALAADQDLPDACYLFDLALPALLSAASRSNRSCPSFSSYATVPASERDLAFVVAETTEVQSVLQSIRKTAGNLLEQVELLDRYQGQPIAAGFCSLAVRLRFRDPNNTLRDEQVEPLVEKVRANLEKSFKADLRC
jgi:phenylalanyl-tRNA synthetase beta chain